MNVSTPRLIVTAAAALLFTACTASSDDVGIANENEVPAVEETGDSPVGIDRDDDDGE